MKQLYIETTKHKIIKIDATGNTGHYKSINGVYAGARIDMPMWNRNLGRNTKEYNFGKFIIFFSGDKEYRFKDCLIAWWE